MNGFQLVGISLSLFFSILTIVSIFRQRLGRRSGLFWLLLWMAAAFAIARPEVTVVAAQLLGIDRGADLVFYTAILAATVGFFLLFSRVRKIDETLTQIVRHLALSDLKPPSDD